MALEIRILGDFEFSRQIISGVARLFSLDNGFGYASGVLLVLYLMWSFIKHALDPEKAPHPIKEFVVGLIMWLIIGAGGMSVKYDVNLTSISSPGQFEQIRDVPFLAAVPSWLASNFFSTLREKMEHSFTPVSYSMGGHNIDPLGALIKLYDIAPTPETLSNSQPIHQDMTRSINNYIKNCFVADHELTNAVPEVSRAELDRANITNFNELWSKFKVSYNGLSVRIFIGDSAAASAAAGNQYGALLSCSQAWEQIGGVLRSSLYRTGLNDFYNARGVNQESIRAAGAMLTGSLAGFDSYQLQLGMFAAYSIRNGLSSTTMETEKDKMIFESWRKRLIEKTGEATIFKKLMIPMITAIETFSFFIAPLMMIMAIMGGVGLSYISKYLMLVLFINLWGFIKVFVDLYTAITVERAFAVNIADGSPFAFAQYPNTFMEIEGFMATAGALTTAIPMFATFLLYGGVHSMMGVMRGMASTSVDASNMAPNVASSMTNGVRQVGDMSHTQIMGTGDKAIGHHSVASAENPNIAASSSFSASSDAALQQATSTRASSGQALVDSVSNAAQQTDLTSNSDNATVLKSFSEGTSGQRIAAIQQILERSGSIKSTDTEAMAIKLAADASAGVGLKLPGMKGQVFSAQTGASVSAAIEGRTGNISQEDWTAGRKALESYVDTNSSTLQSGNSENSGTATSTGSGTSVAVSGSQIESASKQYIEDNAVVNSLGNRLQNNVAINSTAQVESAKVASHYNGTSAQKIFDEVTENQEHKERLSELGFNNSTDLIGSDPSNPFKGFVGAINKITASTTNGGKDDLATQGKDASLASNMWTALSNTMPQSYVTTPIDTMAALHKDISDNINTSINDGQKAVTAMAKPGSDAETLNAQRVELENNHNQANDANSAVIANTATQKVTGAGDGEKVKAGVGDLPKEVDAKTSQANDRLNATQDIRDGGNAIAKLAWNGAGKVVDFFTDGKKPEWGNNSETFAATVSSYANQNGNMSNALRSGIENLSTIGHDKIDPVVKEANSGDFKALTKLSEMNDARLYFQTDEGRQALAALDPKDGGHLVESMNRLEKGIGGLTDSHSTISANELNEISTERMTGNITDQQAQTLLHLGSQKDGLFKGIVGFGSADENVKSTLYATTFGAASDNETFKGIIDNSPQNFNTNTGFTSFIRLSDNNVSVGDMRKELEVQAAKPREDQDVMKIKPYADAASIDIISDTAAVNHNAGGLITDGDTVQGYNMSFKTESPAVAAQMINYRNKIVDNAMRGGDFEPINTELINSALKTSTSSGQGAELVYAVSGFNGANSVPDRLLASGLEADSQAIRLAENDLTNKAFDSGLIVSREHLDFQYKDFINQGNAAEQNSTQPTNNVGSESAAEPVAGQVTPAVGMSVPVVEQSTPAMTTPTVSPPASTTAGNNGPVTAEQNSTQPTNNVGSESAAEPVAGQVTPAMTTPLVSPVTDQSLVQAIDNTMQPEVKIPSLTESIFPATSGSPVVSNAPAEMSNTNFIAGDKDIDPNTGDSFPLDKSFEYSGVDYSYTGDQTDDGQAIYKVGQGDDVSYYTFDGDKMNYYNKE